MADAPSLLARLSPGLSPRYRSHLARDSLIRPSAGSANRINKKAPGIGVRVPGGLRTHFAPSSGSDWILHVGRLPANLHSVRARDGFILFHSDSTLLVCTVV